MRDRRYWFVMAVASLPLEIAAAAVAVRSLLGW